MVVAGFRTYLTAKHLLRLLLSDFQGMIVVLTNDADRFAISSCIVFCCEFPGNEAKGSGKNTCTTGALKWFSLGIRIVVSARHQGFSSLSSDVVRRGLHDSKQYSHIKYIHNAYHILDA